MGKLHKALATKHAALRKVPLGSVVNAMSIPTGFDLIDYACATICEDTKGEEFLNIGLPMGKIYEFIGNSQGGKTTLAYQCADAMVKDLDGDILALDYEHSSNNLRLRYSKINGCTREEFDNRVSLYNHASMSTEFLKELIHDVVALKKTQKKADMVEWTDVEGNDLHIYAPTVIILDSVPAMKPNEVLNDPKLDNNMVAGKMAAANSALLKSIVNMLETYNITLMAINHITTKIVTNSYAPRVVILPGLSRTNC